MLGSYSFPSNEGPKCASRRLTVDAETADIKGAALNIAFSSLGIFLSLGLSGYYRLVNRSRDRKEHGQVAKPGEEEIRTDFDKAAGFRYTCVARSRARLTRSQAVIACSSRRPFCCSSRRVLYVWYARGVIQHARSM